MAKKKNTASAPSAPAAPVDQAAPAAQAAQAAPSTPSAPKAPIAPIGDPFFIAADAVPGWLLELGQDRTVYAPQREGQAVVYRPFVEGSVLETGQRATESAKHAVFPRSESLFTFSKEHDPEAGGRIKTTLQEAETPGPAVVFGALSCDARGFFAFDPVYDGSGTQGLSRDVYYLKRREQTAFIVRACRTALNTCFCHWVGGGPASLEGADVLATEVEGGYVLSPVTERGKALLTSDKLSKAAADQSKAATDANEAVTKSMGDAPDITASPASLLSLFENLDFWRAQSAGCLSCGACTYLCPTCYCFNLTDESNGIHGTRLRTWDNCMSSLFTLEASGHNPRTGKATRLRNRVGHKYSYYPKIHQGRVSCSGCGRCIKSCPSSVDIRRIVQNAITAAAAVAAVAEVEKETADV